MLNSSIISKFKRNDILKKTTEGILFKSLSVFFNYAFLYLVTTEYGVESWGVVAICLATINISSVFGKSGIDIAILKFSSFLKNELGNVSSLYKKGSKLIFSSSIILTFFLCLFSDSIAKIVFDKPYMSEHLFVSFLGIPAFSLLSLNAQVFRSLEKIRLYFLFIELFKFLFPVLIISSFLISTDTRNSLIPVIAFVISLYLCFIISLFFIKKIIRKVDQINVISYKKIISTAIPLLFATSGILLINWSDTLMLGFYRTDYETGSYNMVAKIAQVPNIILLALNGIIAPKISNSFNNGKMKEFRNVIQNSTKVLFYTSIPVFILLFIFSNTLFSLLNISSNEIEMTFLVLLLSQAVNVFIGPVGLILQMIGKQKVFSKAVLFGLVLNITLNIILIKPYGVLGASIASLISTIIWNTICFIFIYKKYKIATIYNPFKFILKE